MELWTRANATTAKGVHGWGTPTGALGRGAATDTGPWHIYWRGAMVRPPAWGRGAAYWDRVTRASSYCSLSGTMRKKTKK